MPRSPDEIPVAALIGGFGITGEIKCDPSNAGRALFVAGARFQLRALTVEREVVIEAVREHKGRLLIRIDGVESLTDVTPFVGATLYAPRDRIKLDANEYLDDDLLGLSVIGVDGHAYGCVERVEHWPSSDMLLVGGRMLPMVAEFIRSVDLEAKRILIDPPAGLLK